MKIFFLIIITLLSFTIQAQNYTSKELKDHKKAVEESKESGYILWSLDTIYNSGKPYAVLIEDEGGIYFDYQVFSLKGKELIQIKKWCINEIFDCYFRFSFIDSNINADFKSQKNMAIEEIIVNSFLLNDTSLNSKWYKEFTKMYPEIQIMNQNSVQTNNTDNPDLHTSQETRDNSLVNTRNRNAPVKTKDFNIFQDTYKIGYYQQKNEVINGNIQKVYFIYSTDNQLIAEARNLSITSKEYKIITLSDHKTHTFTTTSNIFHLEGIVSLLSKNFYL